MKVSISYYGNLIRFKKISQEKETIAEVEHNTTVLELLNSLTLPIAEIAIIQCNGKKVSLDHTLKEGDLLSLYTLMSGG
jgi:sulfur carrier protein ThiS